MGCWDTFTGCIKTCQGKCNDRLMMITNFVAAGLIIVCIVFRFYYMSTSNEDVKQKSIFFILLTFYLIIFLIILILAEIRNRIIRKYFNFLDGKIGRGCFIFFIGLLVFVDKKAGLVLKTGCSDLLLRL